MRKIWSVKILVLLLVVVMAQGCMVRLTDYRALQERHADAVALNEGYQADTDAARAELESLQAEYAQLAAQLDDKDATITDMSSHTASAELTSIWAELKALAAGRYDMTWSPTDHKLLVSVEFDLGRAAVKPSGKSAVKQIAGVIKGMPLGYVVYVDGHTDNLPVKNPKTREKFIDNRGLAAARADAVYRVLRDGGVPSKLMISRGFGQDYPAVPNDSAASRARNRRVEISVVPRAMAFAPTAMMAADPDIVFTK